MTNRLELPQLTLDTLIIPRDVAYQYGMQTYNFVSQGWYETAQGQRVDIVAARDAAAHAQRAYRPGQPIPTKRGRATGAPLVQLYNQTTLAVAQARAAQGYRVAILNFASATSPGGSWLEGARAQEESLARSSALVNALQADEWYNDPRHHTDPFYDDTVIVTPQVPFFRLHTGQLLEQPWYADVLTTAAVHAKAVATYMPSRLSEIPACMRQRTHVMLRAANTLAADVLVLGAWGCGAFGNDATMMADIFAESLRLIDMTGYTHIDFAVADVRNQHEVYTPFARYWN